MIAQTHRIVAVSGPYSPLWPRQPWWNNPEFRLPMNTRAGELAARRVEGVWGDEKLTNVERRSLLVAARMLEEADREILRASKPYESGYGSDSGQKELDRVLTYVAALERKYGEPIAGEGREGEGEDVAL